MKKGELINKGIAATITILFMTFVRPDPEPSLAGVAFTTILMYTVLEYCIRYIRRDRRRQKARRNMRAMHYDGQRWADEWIRWPLKEVS